MPHPLVEQLRFTRSELLRGMKDITPKEALRRFESMNSASWIVGHLACHEQRSWLQRAQGITINTAVEACGFGQPASTPPIEEMWAAWHEITHASDAYLDSLTTDLLLTHFIVDGQPHPENIGTVLRRVTYHYWYHLGEAQAIRQLLGHTGLPQFVGKIPPYRPDEG